MDRWIWAIEGGLSIIDDRREMRTREVEENLLRSGRCRQENDDMCDLKMKKKRLPMISKVASFCVYYRRLTNDSGET